MKKNNIIMVGVLDKKGSTNVSIAKSFMRFDYSVIPINYRTVIQEKGMQFFIDLVINACKKYEPEFIFFCKTNGIPPELISECNKYTKTYYYFMDPIQTAKDCKAAEYAKVANFSSCTGGGVAQWFEEQGVSKCYITFDGLDYDIFKPDEAEIEYDVSFIGSKTYSRDFFAKSVNAKCFGPGYEKSVIDNEFSEVCAKSKFMLSMNTFSDIPLYFSNRLLRYLGCGACVLHYDPTGSLEQVFQNGIDLFYFRTEDELKKLVTNISNETAGKVALNGREKVLRYYTWENFVNNVLAIVEGKI